MSQGSEENVEDTLNDIDELNINAVKNRPALYYCRINVKNRSLTKKAALWIEVAQEVEADVESVKKRWEFLRHRYMQKRKLMTAYRPSGSAATTTTTK